LAVSFSNSELALDGLIIYLLGHTTITSIIGRSLFSVSLLSGMCFMHVSDSFSWKDSGFLPDSSSHISYPYGRDIDYTRHHRVGCAFNWISACCLNIKTFSE
jgi:hypothetical protein